MKKKLLKQLGGVIHSIRKTYELSIEEAADRAQIHATYLAQIERGQRNLSIVTLCHIAAAFNIQPAQLLPENPALALDYLTQIQQSLAELDDNDRGLIINVVKSIAKQLKHNHERDGNWQ